MLITARRFLPLFITQFCGAFNDNMLKNALVVLITYHIAVQTGQNAQVLVTVAAGLFILPFLLFSSLAGQLADKYDRAMLTRIIKIFEILIMCLATIGFIMQNSWFLISVLFASGVHSTFFGPIKYALLPQHLHKDELLRGNAYIEAGGFLAILIGTICGGLLINQADGVYIVSGGLLLIAFTGYLGSRYIPRAEPPAPGLKVNFNLLTETLRIIGYSRINPLVFKVIMANSWFWLIGATFLAQFPTLVKDYLHAQATIVTLFLTTFSVGLGLGGLICSKLLHNKITTKYVPLVALGMSIFIGDLFFACRSNIYFDVHGLLSAQEFMHLPTSWRIMFDLLMTSICGGVYIVPLYTVMQHASDPKYLARIIATNNIFNALFMVISALFTLGMLALSRTVPEVFMTIAIINLFVAYYIKKRLIISL